MIQDFEKFKNREVKAKEIFTIKEIPKNVAYDFIKKYHYLKDAKFFCVYGYGLFYKEELVGCATYSNPQGNVALKGWFGFANDCKTVLELSRLCMLPILNGTNATSYLLGNSMKKLKEHDIEAVITLADSNRHIGSIYQVCNFKYYGLTDKKTDFFSIDGKVNPRGATKNVHGVWLPRTQKHRYCYLLDKSLKILYDEQAHPTKKETLELECCNGTHKVYDNRFNEWYTCPRCTGKLELIDREEMDKMTNLLDMVETYKDINIKSVELGTLFDVVKLKEKEPELYEELVHDYPLDKGNYLYKVV